MQLVRSPHLAFLWLLVALFAVAPSADAQKMGRAYYENGQYGFRFKPLKGFTGVPLQPDAKGYGLAAQMAGPEMLLKLDEGGTSILKGDLRIYAIEDPAAEEVGEDETTASKKRPDVSGYLDRWLRGFDENVAKNPVLDKEVKVKKLKARHRQWHPDAGSFTMLVDAWTFITAKADITLVYVIPLNQKKKWGKGLEKSAKTFSLIDIVESAAAGKGPISKMSYDERLEMEKAEAEENEGWTAMPTKSKKFIVKTSSDNRKFLKLVIDRLEASRELFERDFPPPPGFDHVSIVRVCGSAEEFHGYGNTSAGVAGWFNPSTVELVLFDAVDTNRNMSYAVMTHESFHQYCHFLFEESEAHRWFDEGHGDYYGGAEFRGKRATIKTQMPGGLDRLTVIREMIRNQTYKPIIKHIHYSHSEWQSQGPSNVSCYAQSWSIVYFLREGALGNVSRKVWKEEYADIIPNYVKTLHAGFSEAYEEVREERRKVAADEDREPTEDELKVNRFDLPPGAKDEIWEKAMDASWGQIDVDEFEENWVTYIQKILK